MSVDRDDCDCVNCAIFTLQEKVQEQSENTEELQTLKFQLHQQIQSWELWHREEMMTMMRVVGQNTDRLNSYLRWLRMFRRRRLRMKIPTKSNKFRVFATSSPVFKEALLLADRQNVVEEPWSLALQEKVEFQKLEDFVEVKKQYIMKMYFISVVISNLPYTPCFCFLKLQNQNRLWTYKFWTFSFQRMLLCFDGLIF